MASEPKEPFAKLYIACKTVSACILNFDARETFFFFFLLCFDLLHFILQEMQHQQRTKKTTATIMRRNAYIVYSNIFTVKILCMCVCVYDGRRYIYFVYLIGLSSHFAFTMTMPCVFYIAYHCCHSINVCSVLNFLARMVLHTSEYPFISTKLRMVQSWKSFSKPKCNMLSHLFFCFLETITPSYASFPWNWFSIFP